MYDHLFACACLLFLNLENHMTVLHNPVIYTFWLGTFCARLRLFCPPFSVFQSEIKQVFLASSLDYPKDYNVCKAYKRAVIFIFQLPF